jgi:putative DNA primase/helicase
MKSPAAVKLKDKGDLEFRLGGSAAAQSVAPPSVVDGIERTWIIRPDECEPASLPEPVIQLVLAYKAKSKLDYVDDPMFADIHRELQAAKVEKIKAYLIRHELGFNEIKEPDGRVVLKLDRDPFKPEGHENGNAKVTIFLNGVHSFWSFNAKSQELAWDDLEDSLGENLNPVIRIGPQLDKTVAEAIAALTSDPTVMQRGPLVEVVHPAPKPELALGDNGAPRFRPIPAPILMTKLSACARFERFDKRSSKWVHSKPDQDIVAAVMSSTDFPSIPVATGIVSCPILRADGTIATGPGWDKQTGFYIAVEEPFPPLMPVTKAAELLKDLFCDFPFESEANFAGAVAGLVTLVARPAFDGCAPLFAFDANKSGTGKGILTDTIIMIYEGRRAVRSAMPGDNDELRKAITAAIISGQPYLIFDNIKRKLGGEALENATTATRWSDRILGVSRNIDLAISLVWNVTGNNITMTGDMPRRVVHCRLNTEMERPDTRTGFTHLDLLAYAEQNRAELLMAALSIPAQYMAAGMPDQHLSAWGTFEHWSDIVRSSLVWAQIGDPDTREQLRDIADDETEKLDELLSAWAELPFACTVSTALNLADVGNAPKLAAIVASVPAGKRNEYIGNWLRTSRDSVLDGRKLVKFNGRPPKWQVVNVPKKDEKDRKEAQS